MSSYLTLELLHRTAGDPRRRILLSGGQILSMDPEVGDFVGDVLISGSKIAALGSSLADSGEGAIEVDARGSIVMPGFVDCHLHAWQGQLAGVAPDVPLADYEAILHQRIAPLYQPDDMRIGNSLSGMRCLDSGVTCVIDNSHNSRTPDHSSAAVEGLIDAGIRAVHASGAPIAGDRGEGWIDDLARLRAEYFSDGAGLLTLRMYTAKPLGQRAAWEFARREGYAVSSEIGFWNEDFVTEAAAEGLLTSAHTFNHCAGLSTPTWQLVAAAGVSINVCARSDSTFIVGPAIPPVDEARANGVATGLSMDTEASYGIDMFAEMSALLCLSRGRTARDGGSSSGAIAAADVLEMATVGGAANAALSDRIGSLAPGKEADVILIGPGALDLQPPGNLAATVVSAATPANVEAVFVGGQVRKWEGRLLGGDTDRLRAAGETSRERLLGEAQIAQDFTTKTSNLRRLR